MWKQWKKESHPAENIKLQRTGKESVGRPQRRCMMSCSFILQYVHLYVGRL
jgi:hypothetical protein